MVARLEKDAQLSFSPLVFILLDYDVVRERFHDRVVDLFTRKDHRVHDRYFILD